MLATKAAWFEGHEVVQVDYDPRTLTYDKLFAHASKHDCTRHVWTTTKAQFEHASAAIGDLAHRFSGKLGPESGLRPDKEPKYYLLQTPLRHVPMTPAQAARINANLKGNWQRYLSPAQLTMLATIRKAPKRSWPIVVEVPLEQAWAKVLATPK